MTSMSYIPRKSKKGKKHLVKFIWNTEQYHGGLSKYVFSFRSEGEEHVKSCMEINYNYIKNLYRAYLRKNVNISL
jgi:hypothetical protein